jgi:hypothetical protein
MCLFIFSVSSVIGLFLVIFIGALVLLGIWQRILQSRARSWPVAQARH